MHISENLPTHNLCNETINNLENLAACLNDTNLSSYSDKDTGSGKKPCQMFLIPILYRSLCNLMNFIWISKSSSCIAQLNKKSLTSSSNSHLNIILNRSISTLSCICLIKGQVHLNTWNVSFYTSIPQHLPIADTQLPC